MVAAVIPIVLSKTGTNQLQLHVQSAAARYLLRQKTENRIHARSAKVHSITKKLKNNSKFKFK